MRGQHQNPALRSRRYPIIDALRAALLAMFVYHFCFDLNYFGVSGRTSTSTRSGLPRGL
jgi:uncharacterized membrane protein